MSGKKYDGAYVPADGTYGLRLELKGKHFVLLWRNSPVLETKFTVSDDGSFKLSDSELRCTPGGEPYAVIKDCRFRDGLIVLTEDFPITGESVTELKLTEDSRYGHVTVETDTVAPLLRGKWLAEDVSYMPELIFKGDSVSLGDEFKVKYAAVRYIGETSQHYRIVNADPSQDMIGHLIPFEFDGVTLRTAIPVCDAQTVWIRYKKA